MSEEGLVDYALVFESMPGYSVLLATDAPRYSILAVTNEYLKPSGKSKEDTLGQSLFDVFPPNPEDRNFTGKENLLASFAKVITSGQPHQLPTQRYDIRDEEGKFAEYYWRATNKPVLDKQGQVLYILHTAEDLTQEVKAQRQAEKIKSLEQAHSLLMQAPEAIAIVKGPDLLVELANERIKGMWGKGDDVLGKPLLQIFPAIKDEGFYELILQVMSSGFSYQAYEAPVTRIADAKEEVAYHNYVFQPYYEDDKHKPVGVLIFSTDVTDRVLAKRELKDNEFRFQQMTNSLPLVVWTASAHGGLNYISNQWELEYGNPVKESLGYGWASFIHPEDVERASKAWEAVVQSGEQYETEFRVRHKNGTWPWQLVRAIPIHDQAGKVISWYGTNTDIQDKKATEEVTNYRRTLLEAHNNASLDGVLLVDAKGQIITYNQRFIEVWNMPDEIVKSKDDEAALAFAMTQLVNPTQFIDKVKYLYEHPTETSLDELEFKSGNIIERYGYPVVGDDGSYYAWCWTFKDITQKKLNENATNESETRFRTLANSIPQLAWMTRADGWIYWYNQRWYDYTGTTFEKMQGWGWQAVHHPDMREGVTNRFKKAIEEGNDWEDTFLLKSKEGNFRWFLSRAVPIRNEAGEILQWLGTNTDISDQRKIEEDLKESEERFRSLAETLPQLIWVTDNEGRAEFASKRWEELTGIKPAGEEEWERMIHPDDLENINNAWKHCLATGDIYKFEVRIKSKSGGYLWHAVNGEPVFDAENNIIKWVGAFTDIHQIKEEEQRKNDFIKIVSHELKTPITSIKGYVQLLLMMLDGEKNIQLPPQLSPSLLRIDKLLTKLTRLITEMLDLSRIEAERLELQTEIININTLVEEAIEDIRHSHTHHLIEISHEFICGVPGDKNRLEQVIINLVTNAIKYSADGNKIQVKIHRQCDNQVAVSVQDYGIGIEKKDQEKIFERFYRVEGKTQQAPAGFGIGLFLVKTIVERHGGALYVESEIGQGATFTFQLPVAPGTGRSN